MAKIINCECGYVVRGATDDELVANMEAHLRQDHPELVGRHGPTELLDMAEEE